MDLVLCCVDNFEARMAVNTVSLVVDDLPISYEVFYYLSHIIDTIFHYLTAID